MGSQNKLGSVIKALRKQKQISQTELGELTGFSQNTISNHENLNRSLNEADLQKYAEALAISVSELVSLAYSEKDLIGIFYQLTPWRQKNVYTYAQLQLEQQQTELETSNVGWSVNTVKEDRAVYITDSGFKVAAGVGITNGDQIENTIKIPELPKADYDYPVTVDGDSMEPLYYNGDIAFVKQQNYLDHGEIGIFATEYGTVIKRFYKAPLKNGEFDIKLLSENPAYEPITEGIERIIGKVVK